MSGRPCETKEKEEAEAAVAQGASEGAENDDAGAPVGFVQIEFG